MENQSNVNAGVVVLSTTFLQNTTMNEGIHIHYKNFRFDLTIKDFIKFAKACDTSLHAINEMNQKGELDD